MHPWMPVLAAGLLAVVMAGSRAAQGQEGPPGGLEGSPVGKKIVEIKVEGNQRVGLHEILGQVQSRVGELYDRKLVEEDHTRIFSRGQFEEVRPLTEVTDAGVILTFHVVERRRIESIEFLGVRALKRSDVEKTANLAVGEFINPAKLAQARMELAEYYHSKGYYFAEVALDAGRVHHPRGAAGASHQDRLPQPRPRWPERQRRRSEQAG